MLDEIRIFDSREKAFLSFMDSPLSYLLYFVLAAFPFLPILMGPIFQTGSERSMAVVMVPFGIICFAAFMLAKRSKGYMTWLAASIVLWAAIPAMFRPASGFVFAELYRIVAMFGIIFWMAGSKTDICVLTKIITWTAIIGCLGSWIVDAYGVWERVQAQSGIRGIIGTDNLLSAFIVACIPFAFLTLSASPWLGSIALLLLVPTVLFSESRAGIIIMVLEMLICGMIAIRKHWFPVAILSIFTVIAVAALLPGEKYDWSAVTPFGQPQFSEYSKAIIKDNPFVGVGAGRWGTVAHQMGLQGAWYHPHSEFAITWAEYGLIGLGLLVAFYGINMILAGNYFPFMAVGIGAMLAHSFVAGMRSPVQVFYLAVMIGLVAQRERSVWYAEQRQR